MQYPFKANQFITPVLVYKTKYLLKWQYSNHQFIKSMDTHGMSQSFNKIQACQLFWCEVDC